MKLIVESSLSKAEIEQKLDQMVLGEKKSAESEEPTSEQVGVFRKGGEKMFWMKSGRKYFAWILTAEDGRIVGAPERTLSQVSALFRLGFYAMGLIFMLALIVYEAMEREGSGVFFSVLVGLIPLWLFTISLVLNVVMPRKLASQYLQRRLQGEAADPTATEDAGESAQNGIEK